MATTRWYCPRCRLSVARCPIQCLRPPDHRSAHNPRHDPRRPKPPEGSARRDPSTAISAYAPPVPTSGNALIVAEGFNLVASAMPTASSPWPLLTMSIEGCMRAGLSCVLLVMGELVVEPLDVVSVKYAPQRQEGQRRVARAAQTSGDVLDIVWSQQPAAGLEPVQDPMQAGRLNEDAGFKRWVFSEEIDSARGARFLLLQQGRHMLALFQWVDVKGDGRPAEYPSDSEIPEPEAEVEVFPAIPGERFVKKPCAHQRRFLDTGVRGGQIGGRADDARHGTVPGPGHIGNVDDGTAR